ncbi:MAG: copper uptake system-associated protein [Methylotenera sp.]|nr:copper uptake system-associated protein [Methylotenera sp.]
MLPRYKYKNGEFILIRNKKSSTNIALSFIFGMAVASTSATVQADDNTSHQQIKAIISSTYDKPDHKVETTPIAVIDDYAVADWTQGQRGGRALLHRSNGKWIIMACGADGLKEVKTLTEAGIPDQTAKSLVTQLTSAEKSVSPDRLKQFSLFGTKDDPAAHEHHHHQ